jgi:cellulose synthase/poly-beta-1,6-N-acetylglucosamine synthase-like glycosyltransferase
LVVFYSASLLFIFLYSLIQLNLTLWYLKGRARVDDLGDGWGELDVLPFVTIQLPIYNERYVVERLIDAVASFDYPRDRFEIQVLDDSTDETVPIIVDAVASWRERGVDMARLARPERKGFKAGALQYGMQTAKGEFIAIFDADFVPQRDFLRQTLPWFRDDVGVVQTRWEHINQNYSILTRLQAFALDAHFSIEQGGRNVAGHFINFNGTAGIWRKKTIEDAGGWQADTLTEDLDLSYRAQLKGWKFVFREEIASPAELPVAMSAIKSQQYRWTKGAAETAMKNLGRVFRSPLSLRTKIHAIFHLMNSALFICIFFLGILSVPMLYLHHLDGRFDALFAVTKFGLISTVIVAFFFFVSRSRARRAKEESIGRFILLFPFFLSIFLGLALHNGIAVIEGYLGYKTPFVRTPKFNLRTSKDSWEKNAYVLQGITAVTAMEGLLVVYYLGGLTMCISRGDILSVPFMTMLVLGYAMIFFYTIGHARLTA